MALKLFLKPSFIVSGFKVSILVSETYRSFRSTLPAIATLEPVFLPLTMVSLDVWPYLVRLVAPTGRADSGLRSGMSCRLALFFRLFLGLYRFEGSR